MLPTAAIRCGGPERLLFTTALSLLFYSIFDTNDQDRDRRWDTLRQQINDLRGIDERCSVEVLTVERIESDGRARRLRTPISMNLLEICMRRW